MGMSNCIESILIKLTECQPGLLDLQVNLEVGGETNVSDGSRDFLVVIILPVAVPYPCKRNTPTTQRLLGTCVFAPPKKTLNTP